MKIKLEEQDYIINNIPGFSFSEYLRLMKTKYEFVEVLIRDNDLHPDLVEFFIEFWHTIEPFDVKDAFKIEHTDKKKVYFHCLQPEKIFKSIKSKSLSIETLIKIKVDGTGYKDTYELLVCDGKDLGLRGEVYYITFLCPSTGKRYYLYIPPYICRDYRTDKYNPKITAIDCIAWTLKTDVIKEAVDYFIRQGDVVIAKIKDIYLNDDRIYLTTPRSLTKEEYLNKIKYES